MTTAAHYTQLADETEALARQISREDERAKCLGIARAWRDLAASLERAEAAVAEGPGLLGK